MRFLVDESAPHSAAKVFEEGGHEIIFAKEVLGEGASDPAVVTYAQRNNAIIITWNHKHFNRLVARATQGRRRVGLISFRCPENMGAQRARQCMALIEAEYDLAQNRHDKRVIIEVSRDRVTIVI